MINFELGTIFSSDEYDDAYKYISEKGYDIKEIELDNGKRQFEIVEKIPLTDEQIKQASIAKLKQKLAETDYVVIKIAEVETEEEKAALREEYAEVLANRKAWRAEINELEADNA